MIRTNGTRHLIRTVIVAATALTLIVGFGSPAFASPQPLDPCERGQQQQGRPKWEHACVSLQTATSSQHALSAGSVPVVSPR